MAEKGYKAKSVKTNYLYNLLFEIFAVLTPLVTTPYISRILGPDGVGIYSYTYSIAQYFVIFGNLGISIYGQMKIAEVRDDKYKASKVFYELGILRAVMLLCVTLLYLVTIYYSKEYKTARIILTMFIVSSAFDFSWFFRGIENFSKVVIRDILVKIVMIILIFLFVKKKDDLLLYIMFVSLSALIGNSTYLLPLRRILCKVSYKELCFKEHLRGCITFFIPTIATSIYTVLDKTMLGMIGGSTIDSGFYEQTHKIEQILLIVITSYNSIMRSRMTYLFVNNKIEEMKRRFKESYQYIMFISVAMSCGLIGIAKTFIPLFLGDEFTGSIKLLQIFSLLIVIIGLSNCMNTHYLGPSGKQNKNNIILVIGAFLNAAMNLLLIPKHGATGAAVASIVAEIIILIGYFILSREFISFIEMFRNGWKYIVSGVLMLLVVSSLNDINVNSFIKLFIQLACGSIIYCAILFLLKDKTLVKIYNRVKSII